MDSTSAKHHKMSLVYLIGTYPLLTTTFIDREIQTLRQNGVTVQVISMRKPPAEMPLSPAQRQLQQGVLYLLPSNPALVVLAQLYYMLRRPQVFFGLLAYLLSQPHPNLAARLKTLMHIGQGVYTAFLLRKREFYELHAHFLDRAATIAMVAARLIDKPYSLSIHAGADLYVHPILIPEKIAAARQAVTCTAFNKTHLQSLIGARLSDKITYIPHGLDGSFYLPTEEARDGSLILAVGQLAERKGFAILIEACAKLKEWGCPFECQIVGEGPQHAQLAQQIARHGLQAQVSLCGALPHNEVLNKYRQSVLFVIPCIQTANGDVDGIPNVLLEAMAMQVPVISTNVSAIPELVRHEWNGLLVAPNDGLALAKAMARLLENPALRREMGQHGRQCVLAEYDLETNIRRFANTLWPEGGVSR